MPEPRHRVPPAMEISAMSTLIEAARQDTAAGLGAREQLVALADRLLELLSAATSFTFVPDLGQNLAPVEHYWTIHVDSRGRDTWAITWAHSGRVWSRARSDWLSAEEARYAHHFVGAAWQEVHFTFGEAMSLVPRVLQFQADRARKIGRGNWAVESATFTPAPDARRQPC